MIMRFRCLVFTLFTLIGFSYAQAQEQASAGSDASAVEQAVSKFYQAAQGGWNYFEIDSRLISEELAALLRLAQAVEKRSAREIEASDTPTDKPDIIEGAFLTPFYEGYTKVLAIDNLRKVRDTYLADVKLLNDAESEPNVWTDTAVLVWEDDCWKIDNIRFHGNETDSVKKRLHLFAE